MSHVSAYSWALGLELELVYKRSSRQDPEVERKLSCLDFISLRDCLQNTFLLWSITYMQSVEDLLTPSGNPSEQV